MEEKKQVVYVVTELSLWEGADNHNIWVRKDKGKAKELKRELVELFLDDHNVDGYTVEDDDCSFECFKTNEGFSGNHYCVWVQSRVVL